MLPDGVEIPELELTPDGRISSTAAQFILAGGLTEVINETTEVIPDAYQTEVFALLAFLFVLLMQWADRNGIPYPGQKKLGRVK